jgi:hypothetical protein
VGTGTKVFLVLAAIGAAIATFFFYESRRDAAMTAEASATVTGNRFDKDAESRSLDSTQIRYRFEAAGKAHEGTDDLPGDKLADYPVGRAVPVCYDPKDPSTSSLKSGERACGS